MIPKVLESIQANLVGYTVAVIAPEPISAHLPRRPWGNSYEGTTTEFVWDGDDLVHERVTTADGKHAPLVTWIFEPGTFAPVAKFEGRKRYAVVTDHLGTPTMLMTEAGKLAWKAQLDVYGVPREERAGIAGIAESDATTNPWRYPGQYEDAETGLYYNRFRYYDPESGRYISEDPIGLAGGASICAYVPDPQGWTDPYGLSSCRNGKPRPDIPSGVTNAGWDHIFSRHVPGYGTIQGDVFQIRSGMSKAQIQAQLEKAIDRVWHSGQRVSKITSVMQTIEKRMTIKGMSARYRLVIDTANNRVISFFPALGI